MDPVLYQFFFEDDPEDDHFEALGALNCIVLLGIQHEREQAIDSRFEHRRYLTRADLPPNPRFNTPWQYLYAQRNDRAFLTTMGFDVAAFHAILEGPGRFRELWESNSIPRNDVHQNGEPRLRTRSLDASGALGLILHYLSSAAKESLLQQVFALTPTVCSRYIQFSLSILLRTFRGMREASISWPRDEEEYEYYRKIITERHPLLTGAFGSIDGLKLPGQESDDPEMENATYNGWISAHCYTNVIVFSPDGLIIAATINAPGSWHDSRAAEPIYRLLQDYTPDQFYLVADSAFPTGTADIRGKIRTPPKSGAVIYGTEGEINAMQAFNAQLLGYRQTAEWGMRHIQGSFARLRVPLPAGSPQERRELIEVCLRGANARVNLVGAGQIRNVYQQSWQDVEEQRLWNDLGTMVFKEVRRHDRVARFHLVFRENE